LRLNELMTTDIITVGPDAPLKEAARRMIEAGISGLPVTDDEGELLGVITEADFVANEAERRAPRRARLLRHWLKDEEMPAHERQVRDVMTAEVKTLPPDADHAEAARMMHKEGIKRIPVVREDGRLVGIVSRGDILRAFTRSDAAIVSEITDHILREVLWIDPKLVRISCEDGNVVLSGRLETRSDAQLVAELTNRLDGVASVNDQLSWSYDNTKLETPMPRPGRNR
jgi:CBS domain-containing protein